jgi:hypothetical protein
MILRLRRQRKINRPAVTRCFSPSFSEGEGTFILKRDIESGNREYQDAKVSLVHGWAAQKDVINNVPLLTRSFLCAQKKSFQTTLKIN